MTIAEMDAQMARFKEQYPTVWVAMSPMINYLMLCYVRYAPNDVFLKALEGGRLGDPVEVNEQSR